MAVTNSTAAQNAAANGVVDLVDGGTTNTSGTLAILDGAVPVVDCTLTNPAFGGAAGGIATAAAITDGVAIAAGIPVDIFNMEDRDNTMVFSGDVGQGSGSLNLDNTTIASGQTVSITSFTYQALSS